LTNEDRSLTSNDDKSLKETDGDKSKKNWEPMRLSYTGDAKDVVQGGGGKLSGSPTDPGEARKTPPSG